MPNLQQLERVSNEPKWNCNTWNSKKQNLIFVLVFERVQYQLKATNNIILHVRSCIDTSKNIKEVYNSSDNLEQKM